MTISLNRTQIIGHLGADPEIRTTRDGRGIARLSIATNEVFLDKSGEKQERTEWHRVVVFGEKLVTEIVKPFLKKGSRVFVDGSNRTDKYTDKDGVERYSTDIILSELILLDRKSTEQD